VDRIKVDLIKVDLMKVVPSSRLKLLSRISGCLVNLLQRPTLTEYAERISCVCTCMYFHFNVVVNA